MPIGEHNDWDTGTIEADRGSGSVRSAILQQTINMATNGVLVARPIVPDMPHLVAHLALERFPHFAAVVNMTMVSV